ncbi:MAG: high-potential iron-sulfur protein [Burkholderiales bacterium]
MKELKRRDFLKIGSLAVASFALAARAGEASSQQDKKKVEKKADAAPRLDEKDQQAAALGYKHDATKADKKKFANWAAGQTCENCGQYQGKPKDAWGPCAIFPGKQVAAKGWCAVWVKKA